jgi:hypothetical protein
MRPIVAVQCVAVAAIGWAASPVSAEDAAYEQARLEARRELHLAKSEFVAYSQIEYPRLRRQLDAEIEFADAEARALRERLRWYRSFDRLWYRDMTEVSLQNLRLCLLDAELRLRNLLAERANLSRFRTYEWRFLELRVGDARRRVAQIEAASENAAADEELPPG